MSHTCLIPHGGNAYNTFGAPASPAASFYDRLPVSYNAPPADPAAQPPAPGAAAADPMAFNLQGALNIPFAISATFPSEPTLTLDFDGFGHSKSYEVAFDRENLAKMILPVVFEAIKNQPGVTELP